MATRRSRIQVKPNTGRIGAGGPVKPASPKTSPRKSSLSKSQSVEVAPSENAAKVTDKAEEPPQVAENSDPDAECVVRATICSPVEPEVRPTVAEDAAASARPAEKSTIVAENATELTNSSSNEGETVKPRRRSRVSRPQPNARDPSVRGAKLREQDQVDEVDDNAAQSDRRSEPPMVSAEEAASTESIVIVPSRPSGKAVLEKRIRKENKELQARKRRQYRPGSKASPPDRSSMTMLDLIYYNPPHNPMPEKTSKTTVVEEVTEVPHEEEEENEEESVGPRVRVGPDGEITIDEESLVIRRGPGKDDTRAVVYETGSETHYGSFRKKTSGKRTWTTKETARFYRALSVCGTDFTLMSTFFPKRTRQDLKNKFKREERINRELVDKTINDPTQFDVFGLDDEEEEVEERVDDPDDPSGLHNRHDTSPVPRKRRKGKQQSKNQDKPNHSVVDVEMEVVEVDTAADNVIPLNDEERASTPPPAPQACATPLVGHSPVPGVLSQGQLVFYASHSQEQVVHVFVVSPQANMSASELVSRLNTPPLSQQKGSPARTPVRTTPLGGLASPPLQAGTNGAHIGVPGHSTVHRTPGVSLLPKGITPLSTSPLQLGRQCAMTNKTGVTLPPQSSTEPLTSRSSSCECHFMPQEAFPLLSTPIGSEIVGASSPSRSSPFVGTPSIGSIDEVHQEEVGPAHTLEPAAVFACDVMSVEKSKDQKADAEVKCSSAESILGQPNMCVPLKEHLVQSTIQTSSGVTLLEPCASRVDENTPVQSQEIRSMPLSEPLKENIVSGTDSRVTLRSVTLSSLVKDNPVSNCDEQTVSEKSGSAPLRTQKLTPKCGSESMQTPTKSKFSDLPLLTVKSSPRSGTISDGTQNVQSSAQPVVLTQSGAPLKPPGVPVRRRRAVVCPKTGSEPRVRQNAGTT